MPTRRDFLQRLSSLGLIATLGSYCNTSSLALAQSDTIPNIPNILMIVLDDLNDWVGYLGGHSQTQTPNIDALAAQGTAFQHAYCTVPGCNPSRTSVLTGIGPHTTGVWNNSIDWRPRSTMIDHIRSHGYHAVGGGKITHGPYPIDAWDMKVSAGGRRARVKPPTVPAIGISIGRLDAGAHSEPNTALKDWHLALEFAGLLASPPVQPYFLAYGIHLPHLKWYVPQTYFDRFPLEQIELPLWIENDLEDMPAQAQAMMRRKGLHEAVLNAGVWPRLVQGFLAATAYADDCVGVVLDAWAQHAAQNTYIVLWSDHGQHIGEKEHWHKRTVSENALRVPFIIAGPDIPAQRCEAPVSLLDLYPTLCDLASTQQPEGLEGRSLLPLLQDADTPWNYPVFSHLNRHVTSVRNGPWRFTRYQDTDGSGQTDELYNIEVDPHERKNLANNPYFSEVVQMLAAILPS